MIFPVFGVLAGADSLSKADASLEDEEKTDNTRSSPLGVLLRTVGVPKVQCEPDGLLGCEIRVPRERPQSAHNETSLKVFRVILILEVARDAGRVVVFCLGSLELPLLLVGKEFEDDEKECDTGEDQVGKLEGFAAGKEREEQKVVCGGCKE